MREFDFTIEDHTKIVKFVLEHPMQVLKNLDLRSHLIAKTKPSPIEVLAAISKVQNLDKTTKQKIESMLELYPKIEEAQKHVPPKTKKLADMVVTKVKSTKTVAEAVEVLDKMKSSSELKEEKHLRVGIDVAIDMLKSGENSIYSSGSYGIIFQDKDEEEDANRGKRVRDRDIGTAVGGAITGGITGGPVGAFAGGVISGVAGSAGQAVVEVIDWLFG